MWISKAVYSQWSSGCHAGLPTKESGFRTCARAEICLRFMLHWTKSATMTVHWDILRRDGIAARERTGHCSPRKARPGVWSRLRLILMATDVETSLRERFSSLVHTLEWVESYIISVTLLWITIWPQNPGLRAYCVMHVILLPYRDSYRVPILLKPAYSSCKSLKMYNCTIGRMLMNVEMLYWVILL